MGDFKYLLKRFYSLIEAMYSNIPTILIIEKNQLHRLENSEDIPLQVIEVQTGSNFREDDIIRLEDGYGIADLHRFICS